MRFFIRLLLIVLVVLTGVVAGGALWLRTDDGRRWLAGTVEALLSSEGQSISIGSIEGDPPFSFTLTDVEVADASGTFARIDRLHAVWNVGALLGRTFEISTVEVGDVSLLRLPESGPEEEPAPSDGPPGLPDLPVSIDLERLSVARLALAEPVIGRPIAVSAEGSARLGAGGRSAEARLAVERTDGQIGAASLDFALVPEKRRLDLDLQVSEGPGGLIARAADIPGLPPVEIRLDGAGTLDDWRGVLTASAGPNTGAEATIEVAATDAGYAIDVDAAATLASLLNDPVRSIVGDRAVLKAEVLFVPNESLTLDPLDLAVAAGTVAVDGRYDLAANAVDLRYAVTAGPDSSLKTLTDALRFDAVTLSGTAFGPVVGPVPMPVVRATLIADGLATDAVTVARAEVGLDLSPVTPGDDASQAIGFDVNAVVSGISASEISGNGLPIAELAGPDVTVTAQGAVDPDAATVMLDGLALTTAVGSVTAQGQARDWGDAVEATVRLALEDLSRLAPLTGMPMTGAVTAQAVIAAEQGGQSAEASVEAQANGLSTGTPALDAVLGDAVRLAGSLARDPDGTLRVSAARLDAARLNANAEMVLGEDGMTAQWRAALTDLAPVGNTVGTPLAGSVVMEGRAVGPLDALQADVTVTGDALAVDGRRLQGARIAAGARGLPDAPRGQVTLSATVSGQPVSAETAFAVDGEVLTLSDLGLAVRDGRIGGTVRIALDRGTATGRIAGTLPDLAPVAALAGQSLSGRAEVVLTLDGEDGRQAATLGLGLERMRVAGADGAVLSVRRIDVDAAIADALSDPRVDATLSVADLSAPDVDIASASARANGTPSDLRFEARADGTAGQPLTVALDGAYASAGAVRRLTLEDLNGRYGDIPFDLQRAATLVLGPNRTAIDDLVLRSGDGLVVIDAEMAGRALSGSARLAGSARLERVPLDLARLAAPSLGLSGRLDGSLSLAGTIASPQAEATLSITDARLADLAQTGLAPVNATVEARWRDGRVTVSGNASSQAALDLRLRGSLPLVMTETPISVSVPDGAPVEASMTGTVDLSRLNDLLAERGDRVAGRLDLDARVGGSVSDPVVDGTVVLADGRYEALETGTVITDIAARLVADGNGVTIERFSGNTPNGGDIRVGGRVRFAPGDGDRIDIGLTANNARVLQIDLVTAVIDADLGLRGDFDRALLQGRVKVERTEVTVPDRLPPTIVDLDVIEVNGREAARSTRSVPIPGRKPTAPDQAAPAEAPPTGFDLALDVTVEAPNQIFVRGRGLDAEFGGRLQIGGTASAPDVEGGLTLIKGQVDVLTKTLEFRSGSIDFAGGTDLNPQLNLVAETSAGEGTTARIAVTGSASSPQLSLSAEPELPQDEILSRILFEKPVDQLSAVEAIQLAQSAAALAGIGGGSGVLDQVRNSLGIDRLEFVSGEGGLQDSGIAAGRYITDDVYVGVEQGFGNRGSRARVEVDITDNIQLESDIGTDSDPSFGLKFEWDY